MPSKPVLSEEDKKNIRGRLRELCEACWIAQGYRRTSIKGLCAQANISIGTFYTLYPAKELLFAETMEGVQRRLGEAVLSANRRTRTKEGFAQSLKVLFREYDSKPFLYNVTTPDFQALAAKLPAETLQRIQVDSAAFFQRAVQAAGLTLRMEPSQACGILSALLSTIAAKETLTRTCDYLAVFDCMAEALVERIFV